MAIERTFSMVKPDAVAQGHSGRVLAAYEEAGLKLCAIRRVRLGAEQAARFYEVHRERPFYSSLTAYMTSGPVVAMVLEGEDAIARVRAIMGATDPARAAEGTLRRLYGSSIERNVVHGSDGPDTARAEVGFFFSQMELT